MDNINLIEYDLFTKKYRALIQKSQTPFRVPLSSFNVRIPITSYGIILKHKEKFCCLKRKFTVEYTDFIRGNYRESNLYFLLRNMTFQEREILKRDFNWQWTNHCGKPASGEPYEYAYLRWMNIVKHIETLCSFVTPCDLEGKSKWLWPKGRIDYHPLFSDRGWSHSPTLDTIEQNIIEESPINCAMREFKEETVGFNINESWAISKDPVCETYLGTNSKNYQTYYFPFLAPEDETFVSSGDSLYDDPDSIYWLSEDDILEKFCERRKEKFKEINWNSPYSEIDENWKTPVKTYLEDIYLD